MRVRLELTRWAAVGLLAIAFGADGLGAQDLRIGGVVHDSSGAVVSRAKVELRSQSYTASTFTSPAGDFVFEHVAARSGTLVVSASHLQENRYNWDAGDANLTHLEITLNPTGATQQVTVTARVPTPLGDSPISDRQLTSDDLTATPNLALDDTLRQIPGFTLFRRSSSRAANPTTQGVTLRGLSASGASRTLVLAGGVPLNDPFGGWVYWGRVPEAAIDRIEIVRGALSDLYGADAVGGVIHIVPLEA